MTEKVSTEKDIRVHVRPMTHRDMPEVLDIEEESFEFSWPEEDFIYLRDCTGMVAEYGDRVVGFTIYEMHQNHICVLNFAVASDYRRRGVGSQMVAKLKSKATADRRNHTELLITERNLAGQLFWQARGFRSVRVVRTPFTESDDDGYLMRYDVGFDEGSESSSVSKESGLQT